MWNLVYSFAQRAQDAALSVNRHDWIRFVAALYEPRHTGLGIARQPRDHAKFLALGQLYHQVRLFEREFRRHLDERPEVWRRHGLSLRSHLESRVAHSERKEASKTARISASEDTSQFALNYFAPLGLPLSSVFSHIDSGIDHTLA